MIKKFPFGATGAAVDPLLNSGRSPGRTIKTSIGTRSSPKPSTVSGDTFLGPRASSVPAQFTANPDNDSLGAHASSVPCLGTNRHQDNPEVLHDPSAATSLFSSGRNPNGTFKRGHTFGFCRRQSATAPRSRTIEPMSQVATGGSFKPNLLSWDSRSKMPRVATRGSFKPNLRRKGPERSSIGVWQ